MIAKVFRKSRPINFIIIILLLMLSFTLLAANAYQLGSDMGFLANFPLFLCSLLLTDFIAKKNDINKGDSFALLFFLMFLWLIPDAFTETSMVASNFFVILAFRRLVSIHSLLVPKQKIFDAALWIGVAALFEFWALLFLIPLYVSIFLHIAGNIRNWLIPVVSFFTVSVLVFFYALAFDDYILEYVWKKAYISFNFQDFYFSPNDIAFIVVTLLLVLSQLLSYKFLLIKLQRAFKIILSFLLVTAVILVISVEKNNTYLLYCFAPVSMLASDFMKKLPKIWLKEGFITLLFLGSLAFFLLNNLL